MKFRIIRKKIKKHHIIDMWLRSMDDWHNALDKISAKYPKDTDINDYDKIDQDIYIVGCDMLRFDWSNYLKAGEKIGFGYRIINKYANEKF